MLVVGVFVLVLGVAFFIKYSFDRHWINETTRVVSGTVTGLTMWLAGLIVARRRYPLYGRMIAGAGLAILYLSAYAASALYHIVPSGVALGWMALLAAATVMSADREDSPGLAMTALALAFLAPFLLASPEDHHVTLFVYDAALIAATFWLVRRHDWLLLGPVSFWLTWTTFGLWASQAYSFRYFIATEAYLTYVMVMFVLVAIAYRRSKHELSKYVRGCLWAGPALYHAASVAVLFDHSAALLVYFVVLTAAMVALFKEVAWRRLLIWITVALPFAAWTTDHSVASWYVATLAVASTIYALHLIAQLRVLQADERITTEETFLFHVNSLGFFGLTYAAIYNHAGSTAGLAAGLTVWNGALALLSHRRQAREPMVNALALTFTFAALAVALSLAGSWITVAWAAEGGVVIWSGLLLRRTALRHGGALLLTFAVARLVVTQFAATDVSFVLLLNSRAATGAFIVGLLYAAAALYRRLAENSDDTLVWISAFTVAANLLTLALLTADAYSFWELRSENFTAAFARQASVSVLWAAYGMALIALGFKRSSVVLRYLALAILGVTVGKLFTTDLLELDGIYRIIGFMTMGVVLLAASFLYQRIRRRSAVAV